MFYKLEITKEAKNDLDKISEYLENYINYRDKVIEKINTDIINLRFMPRIHKTVTTHENPKGEYRRIVSGNYVIIYQINKEKIRILRVFSEKQNYFNQTNFILKEKSIKYILNQIENKE